MINLVCLGCLWWKFDCEGESLEDEYWADCPSLRAAEEEPYPVEPWECV